MEFESVMEEELLDTIYNTKTLKDNKGLCIICQCDETEGGKQWDRKATQCAHITHSRFYRRWCSRQGKMHCAYCGCIKSIKGIVSVSCARNSDIQHFATTVLPLRNLDRNSGLDSKSNILNHS